VAADTVSYRLCYTGSTICSPGNGQYRRHGLAIVRRHSRHGPDRWLPGCREGRMRRRPLDLSRRTRRRYCRSGTGRRASGSLLNFTTPASSAIYSVPSSGLLTDGVTSHSSRAALANDILLWVAEGGYFTELGRDLPLMQTKYGWPALLQRLQLPPHPADTGQRHEISRSLVPAAIRYHRGWAGLPDARRPTRTTMQCRVRGGEWVS
jgi:hypothetical protein